MPDDRLLLFVPLATFGLIFGVGYYTGGETRLSSEYAWLSQNFLLVGFLGLLWIIALTFYLRTRRMPIRYGRNVGIR